MLQKQPHRLTVFSWTYWGILPFLMEESLCYFLKYQFIFPVFNWYPGILRFFIRSCQIYSFHIPVCKYSNFQPTLYLGLFLFPVPIITASAQIYQADTLCSFALTDNCPDSAGCLPEILPSPSLQMHFMDPSVHYFPLTNQPVFPSPSK